MRMGGRSRRVHGMASNMGNDMAMDMSYTEGMDNDVSGVVLPVLAPPIVIADATPTKIKIPYDIALNESSVPDVSAYVLGSGRTFTLLEVIGSDVWGTVSSRYYWGDTESVAYTAPATNMIKSTLGGEADSFTATAVTNNIVINSATTTLIAVGRYTDAPTDALKALINRTLVDIEAYTGVSKADVFYVRGVHEALLASQNWAKNAHNCTLTNNPTFTPKVGFQGNGTTMSINMNYNPATEAENYGLTAGTIIFMHPILGTTSGRSPYGAQDNVAGRRNYAMYYTNPLTRIHMNTNTYNENANMLANVYFATTRNGSTLQGYLDGIAEGAPRTSAAEASLVDLSQLELANNVGGTPTSLTNAQTAFFWQGGLLTQPQILGIVNVMKYFYATVGGTF